MFETPAMLLDELYGPSQSQFVDKEKRRITNPGPDDLRQDKDVCFVVQIRHMKHLAFDMHLSL